MDPRQEKQIRVVLSSKPVDQLDNEAVVLFSFENRSLIGKAAGLIDQRLNGVISQLIEEEKITGTYGERVLVASEGRIPASKILMLGLGTASSLMYERLGGAASTIFPTLMKIQVSTFAAFLPIIEIYDYDYSKVVEIFLEGVVSGLMSMRYTPETILTVVDESRREKEIMVGLSKVRKMYRDKIRILIVRGESARDAAQSNSFLSRKGSLGQFMR